MLLQKKFMYKMITNEGKPVCDEQAVENRVNPCDSFHQSESTKWEKPGECNISTCMRSIDVFTKVPEGCQCITKRYVDNTVNITLQNKLITSKEENLDVKWKANCLNCLSQNLSTQ